MISGFVKREIIYLLTIATSQSSVRKMKTGCRSNIPTPLGLEYEAVDVASGLVMSRKTYDSMSQLAKLTDFICGSVTEDVMGRVTSETAKQRGVVFVRTLYAYDDAAESGA